MASPPHDAPQGSPTDGLPADVQAAYLKLHEAFRAGLAQRWTEIETAPDHEVRRAALHRLAGAAGSYGFTALGKAARRAELACAPHVEAAALEAALAAVAQQLCKVREAPVTVS